MFAKFSAFFFVLVLAGVMTVPFTVAHDVKGVASVNAAAEVDVEAVIRAKLQPVVRGEITSITAAHIDGLHKVKINGVEEIYVSSDGRYIFDGDMLEVQGRRVVNVRDQGLEQVRQEAIAGLSDEDMVQFIPVGDVKADIYVYTDVDCGYCRKLHGEINQLLDAGIQVNYLAFPRSGVDGSTYTRMARVWCSDDKRAAMTAVKQGASNLDQSSSCNHPVTSQYELGITMGVRGTPAVFLADGKQLGGYVPAPELIKMALAR